MGTAMVGSAPLVTMDSLNGLAAAAATTYSPGSHHSEDIDVEEDDLEEELEEQH